MRVRARGIWEPGAGLSRGLRLEEEMRALLGRLFGVRMGITSEIWGTAVSNGATGF